MNGDFKQKVIDIVKKIPHGRVMSYGQVAAWVGSPRAARQVGFVLRGYEGFGDVPWWRVVNSRGILSIKGNLLSTKEVQKNKLLSEGVIVSEGFMLDMKVYQFKYSANNSKAA